MHAASFVSTSVNHPTLSRMDSESVPVFHLKYDQYCKEFTARARQLTAAGSISTEPIRPVNLTFCVDPETLESGMGLGFSLGADDINTITDEFLRNYLDTKCKESTDTVTLEYLDSLVRNDLVMEMSDKSARSRMETIFFSYHKLLSRNGLKWILENNQKVTISHVLSAVKPKLLRDRLGNDLEFSKYECRKDFRKFMKHAVDVSKAFEFVDTGPRSRKDSISDRTTQRRGLNTDVSKTPSATREASTKQFGKKGNINVRLDPPCPHGPCKSQGLRHWIQDCRNSTDLEKAKMHEAIAATKSKDGLSRPTRSQTTSAGSQASATKKGTFGRLANQEARKNTAINLDSPISISDGLATVDGTGRCDDGSDDSLASCRLAEQAALKGIGKLTAIPPVRIQVALKTGDDAQSFSFSRTWEIPRTVLHLASGQLAVANVRFLVADDELDCEDLIIGLPVLRHLQIDTRTLLENNRSVLDGSDCSRVGNRTTEYQGGVISRMMSARLRRDISTDSDKFDPPEGRPRVNYYETRSEQDPLLDPSLLDPVDEDQHESTRTEVDKMVNTARENGLQSKEAKRLGNNVETHLDVFRTAFSAGPPVKLRPLQIELTSDARPVKLRLRKYSQAQNDFLIDMVDDLVRNGMAYANPTSPWACAPLLVLKPGPARFRFTVDLRPVNKFTIKHQYPMPNIEHELGKLATAQYFATFDLSHGYWQLELDEDSRTSQSFITPSGIYSPTRFLHVTMNAVTHLQSALTEVLPSGLRAKLLAWLDDILIYASTVSGLVYAVEEMLLFCTERNIKLHPGKC